MRLQSTQKPFQQDSPRLSLIFLSLSLLSHFYPFCPLFVLPFFNPHIIFPLVFHAFLWFSSCGSHPFFLMFTICFIKLLLPFSSHPFSVPFFSFLIIAAVFSLFFSAYIPHAPAVVLICCLPSFSPLKLFFFCSCRYLFTSISVSCFHLCYSAFHCGDFAHGTTSATKG